MNTMGRLMPANTNTVAHPQHAFRSTGPRTAAGWVDASMNALRSVGPLEARFAIRMRLAPWRVDRPLQTQKGSQHLLLASCLSEAFPKTCGK